jgi:Zn-dependent peptidase ImmA (M78 family)
MLKRGFKAEAERLAAHYRKELGINEHAPLAARQLAEHMDILLLTPADIPGIDDEILRTLLVKGKDFWSAAIYRKEDREFIIYNPTHSLPRQESDLMHELAHAICKHELSDLESAIMGCIIPLRKYDEDVELEAEWLGACLQLPKKALLHHHIYKKVDVQGISSLFTASEKMVRYRIGISGVQAIKNRRR